MSQKSLVGVFSGLRSPAAKARPCGRGIGFCVVVLLRWRYRDGSGPGWRGIVRLMSERDDIYSGNPGEVGDFRFDERVVKVFPDMISRSVPGYGLMVPLIGLLARRFVQPGSNVYDLGCSLGAATLAMRRAIAYDDVQIVAVDVSQAMVKRCCEIVAEDNSRVPVSVSLGDVRDADIDNASVIVLNFTLQFLAPAERQALISRLYQGLNAGGALILSEKLHFEDAAEQQLQTDWHHDFKRSQGYSDLEIARKRTALENVMVTDSQAEHRQRLAKAGFEQVYCWFRCFSFASLIAIK